jgi:hypothetical protein
MHWKANDESFLLVLVPPPEDTWIILCVHDMVLHHQLHALTAFVSCRALSHVVSPPPRFTPQP